MSVLRNVADWISRGIASEIRYRRENPDRVAKMFRDREKFWRARGRRVLANIAARRAERWEARDRARQKQLREGDC